MDRDNGPEEIAEDGMPGKLAERLADHDTVVPSDAVTTPVDADDPVPLTPADSYEFSFDASTGPPPRYLSAVTTFVPSTDLFYALGTAMAPLTGDVTDDVGLWDAGTELKREPGVGENQVQGQRGAGIGDVERGTVAPIEAVNGYGGPTTSDVLEFVLGAR